MSKADIWMPLYIGDYLADTMYLSTLEHGAYLLLLMAYWKTGGPIPSDDKKLAAIARMSLSEFSAIRPAMQEFFTEDGGQWRNKRADEEIAKWGSFKDDKGFGAALSNQARYGTPIPEKFAQRHAEWIAQRTLSGSPSPSPSPLPLTTSKPKDKTKAPAKPPRFDPEEMVLPLGLNTKKWVEWIAYRKARHLSTTQATWGKQLEFLGTQADPAGIIDASIANGWQGLFPPKASGSSGSKSRDDERKHTFEVLTGKKSNDQRPANTERDITGESVRIA